MARIDYDDVDLYTQGNRRPDDPSEGQYPDSPEPAPSPAPSPTPTPTPTTTSQAPPPFDPSRVPAGVPRDWAEDFIRRNPNDYSRIGSAYGSPAPARTTTTSQDPRWPTVPNQFSDPYTQQYEGILQAQLELLRMQQQEMQRQAQAAQARRGQAEAAWGKFSDYANQRVNKLQGPAYTGTEQEVLRSQLLDPMERDRAAAHKRALEQISARGMTPESGLAAELQRMVDQEYNQYRSGAQGALAQRQIEEQRSREQEAQQLLMLLAQMPDALARGDLDFVNYVQGLVTAPGTQQIAVGNMMADLPRQRLDDALRVLGIGPSGLSGIGNNNAQLMQLLQLLQQQRFGQQNQWGNFFGNLGLSFQPR